MALATRQARFIQTMLPLAMEASERTGLDPRLIVAQAAQETGWGEHAPGNNFFGIKSHGEAGGQTLATDEVINGNRVRTNADFRTYGGPRESVAGYVDFLTSNPRYRPMLEAEGLDAQLAELGRSGYATDPNYARSVGQIAKSIPIEGERMAQAESGSDAPRYSRTELLREAQRRGLVNPPAEQAQRPGFSREELMAEAQRRGLVQSAPAQKAQGGFFEDAARMPRAMIADVNAGYQGVNPVSVSKATPLGFVTRDGDDAYLDVDGTKTLIPPETYDQYVTQVHPETGQELLYRRTEDLEESPLASAGRVLGYGVLGGPGQGVKQAARTPVKGGPPQDAMRAMQAHDVTPSLGMTGPTGARAAAAMEGFATTAGRAMDDAARADDELAGAVSRTAGQVGGGGTPFEGGQALLSGANDFLVKNLKGTDALPSRSARLFARVDKAIPKDTQVNVADVAGQLKAFIEPFENAPNIGTSVGVGKWQGWLNDIAENGGQLTWEQARALRTEIGEAIGKMTGPMADAAGGKLKQLYGALTRDLTRAANGAGPEAAQAWKRAQEFHKAASQRVDEALDILFKAKSPEQAYENFLALGRSQGSRANIKKLLEIKRSLPEEEWSNVVGTVIRRMGQATPGTQDAAGEAFSASRFLTDWNKLAPAAKNALFEGKGVPKGLKPELDALATVMETAKNAARQTNASRSGSVMGNLGMVGLGIWDATTALGTAVLSHITARALTNPRFLRGVRNYIARGGNKAAAQKLLEAAGENRALISDAATLIRIGAQEPSPQLQLPPPTRAPGALAR